MADLKWEGEKYVAKAINGAKAGVDEAGNDLINKIMFEKLSGQVLNVRGGRLRDSIDQEISDDELSTRVGTNVEYGKIHEFGGTITGKSGMLPIPISAEAKKASKRGEGPRSFGDRLRFVKTPRNALLVKDIGGKNKRTEVMYVLKKSVQIPARPYITPAFHESLKKIEKTIAASVNNAIGGKA